MKKNEFAKLALMGLTGGILASNAIDALQGAHSEEIQKFIAAQGCGGKKGCGGIAKGCGSKCNSVADNGRTHSCNAVAGNCGSKCNSVADNGRAHSCNAIADKCSAHGCNGVVAEREAPKSLTSPAPIPKDSKENTKKVDLNDQNIGYHLLTEDEFTLELNDQALKTYQELSPEAKALARLVASARCNGTNECKGLNACKTDTNKCAGQGSCKGTGKCAFSDKNLVVRLVAEKMKTKREALTK